MNQESKLDGELQPAKTHQHLHWTASLVEAELRERGFEFTRHSLLHGRQLILFTGEIVNVYPDGVISVSGDNAELSRSLSELQSVPPSSLSSRRRPPVRW